MRSFWLGILVSAMMIAACGDDDSDFSTRPSDGSSSSRAKSSSSAKSSDSVVGCKTETEDNCEYSELADDRDGQTYKTVAIGEQTWMAENLNFETENSFCYNDSAEYCAKYGRLYTWEAATTACPSGWHLPTKAEFEILFTAVGGKLITGEMLKSTSGWHDSGNGSDAFAFSALPAGYRDGDGYYDIEGLYVNFWSSTECDSGYAYNMGLYYSKVKASLKEDYMDDGFSVRCVKD